MRINDWIYFSDKELNQAYSGKRNLSTSIYFLLERSEFMRRRLEVNVI
jgi:predicted cupin superfamily sugar epimerase